jgi:hypothetical protein
MTDLHRSRRRLNDNGDMGKRDTDGEAGGGEAGWRRHSGMDRMAEQTFPLPFLFSILGMLAYVTNIENEELSIASIRWLSIGFYQVYWNFMKLDIVSPFLDFHERTLEIVRGLTMLSSPYYLR